MDRCPVQEDVFGVRTELVLALPQNYWVSDNKVKKEMKGDMYSGSLLSEVLCLCYVPVLHLFLLVLPLSCDGK